MLFIYYIIMIFTVLGSVLGLGTTSWFFYKYQHEDRAFSNEELAIMSRKMMNENTELHRARKTVLTIEELRRMDPTCTPPDVPTYGEPDI